MTIAMLSWKSHKTLVNTLESYRKFNLDDNDKLIYFQEMTDKDVEIAHTYGFRAFGGPTNIGIGPALQILIQEAKGEHFLFLENDWELLRDARNHIGFGEFLLSTKYADVVRYRSRENPGWPLWSKQFEGNELDSPDHLLDCVHWREHPDKDFPEQIHPLEGSSEMVGTSLEHFTYYATTSRYANFTNNPCMYRTEFLRNVVAPKAYADGILLEVSIHDWWKQQKFKVAQGDGLFTHHRID